MDVSSSPAPENNTPPHTDSTPAATAATKHPLVKRVSNGKVLVLPHSYDADRPFYRPHGKWAWAEGHEILSYDRGFKLGYGLEGHVYLKLGRIDGKEVTYITKLCSVWNKWDLFFSSLYLNASSNYLRQLQGDVVPWIIGVNHCNGGQLGLAQDIPHPIGWREADPFLEEEHKEAIIAAYKKLHDRGVLHGDAQYRHWLIGDDKKVTLIDFGLARATKLDAGARTVGVESCSQESLSDEMRKVKYMLDYKDSRTMENRLAQLRHEREQRDRENESRRVAGNGRLRVLPRRPKESLSEEEKAAPFLGRRLKELEEWWGGDTWTAHRYEVVRVDGRVRVRKTPIPRPQITPAGDHNSAASSSPKPEVVAPVSQPGSATSCQVAVSPAQSPSATPPADVVSTEPDAPSSGDTVQVTVTRTTSPTDQTDGLSGSLKRARENSQEDSSPEIDDASTQPHGPVDGGSHPGNGSPRCADLPPNKRRRCSTGSGPEAIKPSQPAPSSLIVKTEAGTSSAGKQDIPANSETRPAGLIGILKSAQPGEQQPLPPPPPPKDESTSLENRASSSKTDVAGRAKGKSVKRGPERPVKRLRFADKVTAINPKQTKWSIRSDKANSSSSSDSDPEAEPDESAARFEQKFKQFTQNTSDQARHPGILNSGTTSGDIKQKAVEHWFRFDALRTQYVQLHRRLEQMRKDAESHRDGFMFGMLSIPAAERKTFLRSFGKQHYESILGYLTSTNVQTPGVSRPPPPKPKMTKATTTTVKKAHPNVVLRDARAQAVLMVAERGGPTRCPTEHNRVTQIKKAAPKDYAPRVRSKLGPASGSLRREEEYGVPTDSSSSSSDESDDTLPGDVTPPNSPPGEETTLQKAERYRMAVMRRAEAELEREKRAAAAGTGIARTVSYAQLDLGASQSREEAELGREKGAAAGTGIARTVSPSREGAELGREKRAAAAGTGIARTVSYAQLDPGASQSREEASGDSPAGMGAIQPISGPAPRTTGGALRLGGIPQRVASFFSRGTGADGGGGGSSTSEDSSLQLGSSGTSSSSSSSEGEASTRSSARKRKGGEIDDDDDDKTGGDKGASKKKKSRLV